MFARILSDQISVAQYDKRATITELFLSPCDLTRFSRVKTHAPRLLLNYFVSSRRYFSFFFFFFIFSLFFSSRIGHAESKEHLFVFTLRFSRTRIFFSVCRFLSLARAARYLYLSALLAARIPFFPSYFLLLLIRHGRFVVETQ